MSRALATFRLLLAGAVLWAAAFSGAAPAAADEPAPAASAVARLNAEETAALVRRFPDWEKKPAVERERIATNVLRLRLLSPADRARFFERLRRAEAAGPAVLADLPDRLANFGKLRPDERGRAKEGGRIERAMVGAVRTSLSPTALAAVDALAPGERGMLAAGIVAHWRQRATQGLQGDAPPEGEVTGLSPEDAERFERLRTAMREHPAQVTPRDRMWLGSTLMKVRLRLAASAVPAPTPDLPPDARKAHEKALQSAMGTAFPAARDTVVADLEAAVAKGRDGLLEYAKLHAPTPPRTPTLVGALMALERSREFLTDDGRAKVDEVQTLFLQALKVPDEDIARFRAAKTPGERGAILWDLQQRPRRPRDPAPGR